jgi:hypothetical protein
VGGTAGWLACSAGPSGLATALVAGAFTLTLCLAGLFLTCRDDLRDTLRVAGVALAAVASRTRRAAVDA